MPIFPIDSVDSVDSIHPVHPVHLLLSLPLDREPPERLQVHPPQRALLGGVEVHARHGAARDAAGLEGPQRLEPAARAQAPPAAAAQARRPQVVALRRRVVEELVADDARHRVVAAVQRARAAVAVAVEARHGLRGEELERLAEDWGSSSAIFLVCLCQRRRGGEEIKKKGAYQCATYH